MKNRLFFFVSLILLSNLLYSQIRIKEISSTLPTHLINYSDTETRKIIPFNDNWIITPYNSDKDEVVINVPARFTSDDVVLFEKTFEFSNEIITKNSIKIHFHGVSYSANIYLNDVVVYKKLGGNIPFSFSLPSDLLNTNGKNKIGVKVSNKLDSRNTIPLHQRFLFPKNSGGVVRDVFLQIIPKENVEVVRYSTLIDDRLRNVDVKFDVITNQLNKGEEYLIDLSIFDANGKLLRSKKRKLDNSFEELELSITLKNPKFWSYKTPYLHTAEIKLTKNDSLIDVQKKQILFAKFEKRPEGLFLNNQNFEIKGVTYIHSNEDYGMVTSYSNLRKDLELIKELGINTVRFAKAIPHPFALEICAELGLLAFVEIPLNSVPNCFVEDNIFNKRIVRFTEEFVKEYSSYPAVFAIGVGGGYLSNSDKQIGFIAKLGEIIKLKSQKLSYSSFIGIPLNEIDNIDLYGVELFANSNRLEKYFNTTSINKNKLFISEATYPTHSNDNTGYLNNFTLEAQAKFFKDVIGLSYSKELSGFFINSMFDYYGDFSSLFASYPSSSKYNIGILGVDRDINRISYNLIKSELVTNKRVTIPLGSEKDDAPIFFILMGLLLSVLMGILVNSKKKFREDATRALLRPYNFFADIRDHRIISGFATLILMFILSGANGLLLSNLLFYFKNSIIFEKILLAFGIPFFISIVNYLAWHPYESFFFFTLISIALFFIVSVTIQFSSFFLKIKIYFRNVFITVVWAVLPISIFLPVKMVLYRILEADIINPYIFGFIILYMFWILQRMIKGIHVIFDISLGRTYFYTILLIVITLFGILLYFQLSYSTINFLINSIYQAQLI